MIMKPIFPVNRDSHEHTVKNKSWIQSTQAIWQFVNLSSYRCYRCVQPPHKTSLGVLTSFKIQHSTLKTDSELLVWILLKHRIRKRCYNPSNINPYHIISQHVINETSNYVCLHYLTLSNISKLTPTISYNHSPLTGSIATANCTILKMALGSKVANSTTWVTAAETKGSEQSLTHLFCLCLVCFVASS